MTCLLLALLWLAVGIAIALVLPWDAWPEIELDERHYRDEPDKTLDRWN